MHVSQKPPLMDFFLNISFKKKKNHFFQYFEKKELLRGWPHTNPPWENWEIIRLLGSEKHDRDSNTPSLTLVLHAEQTCLKRGCLEGLLTVQWICTSWDRNGNNYSVILHILNLWSASWYLNAFCSLSRHLNTSVKETFVTCHMASCTLKSTKMTVL